MARYVRYDRVAGIEDQMIGRVQARLDRERGVVRRQPKRTRPVLSVVSCDMVAVEQDDLAVEHGGSVLGLVGNWLAIEDQHKSYRRIFGYGKPQCWKKQRKVRKQWAKHAPEVALKMRERRCLRRENEKRQLLRAQELEMQRQEREQRRAEHGSGELERELREVSEAA